MKYQQLSPCKEKKMMLPKSTYNLFGDFGVHKEWFAEAKYFEPKEGHKRIHKGNFASWACTMITKAIFPCDKLNIVVKPYSPHRFSRQFGYHLEILGVFTHDICKVTLDDRIRYWQLCTLSKSISKARFSSMLPNAKKFSLEDYKKWWAKIHGNYFESNIESLINSKLNALVEGEEHDKKGDPFVKKARSFPGESKKKSHPCLLGESGSSNADCHWKRQMKDFRLSKSRNDSTINPSSIEVLAKEVIFQAFWIKYTHDTLSPFFQLEREILVIDDDDELQDNQGLAKGPKLFDIITPNTETTRNEEVRLPKTNEPSHCVVVSILKGKKFVLNNQMEFLKKLCVDIHQRIADNPVDSILSIQLEKLLKVLFDKANAYDEARSTSSEKTSKKLLAPQLEELESIEKELDNLQERKKNPCVLLKRQQQLLQSTQTEVYEIEEEIVVIKNALPSIDEVIENLKTVGAHLEAAKEE
ncbi:hypothetical protein CDL12_23107 [Handroanthus impetiginosus]|uniref:Aminotransferase-like plant mobile domain-containing protein n=1 Tax=Handroanthus impetiginosus TaxID=429701 RepID=A0A2G9GGE3_9LAMI|nr:hypothetical protein CDL12_23107 [Handroanthus impetiginosus]